MPRRARRKPVQGPSDAPVLVTLPPDLSHVLARLAKQEGYTAEVMAMILINEALAHRILIRPFHPLAEPPPD